MFVRILFKEQLVCDENILIFIVLFFLGLWS